MHDLVTGAWNYIRRTYLCTKLHRGNITDTCTALVSWDVQFSVLLMVWIFNKLYYRHFKLDNINIFPVVNEVADEGCTWKNPLWVPEHTLRQTGPFVNSETCWDLPFGHSELHTFGAAERNLGTPSGQMEHQSAKWSECVMNFVNSCRNRRALILVHSVGLDWRTHPK